MIERFYRLSRLSWSLCLVAGVWHEKDMSSTATVVTVSIFRYGVCGLFEKSHCHDGRDEKQDPVVSLFYATTPTACKAVEIITVRQGGGGGGSENVNSVCPLKMKDGFYKLT